MLWQSGQRSNFKEFRRRRFYSPDAFFHAEVREPTKVVESLASATPVICNLTSDLADYIKDGYNGIIVNDESAKDFSLAVEKAVKLSVSEKELMSKNARITAENSFSYKLYKDEAIELMSDP